ncbi:hypothetical protein IW140_000785 [Coemansia sp. RSA 1813]|nr:hypothetical protein EV178_000711 [Coemansia sp. RSA 1646]KAJ1773653.1 hypothetical protein LPJ74_000569 [Coemansia sp. RSA 1843]KAJ2092330.1 hypothetical protein IW138_001092 [Coemansia sp. RSA 986]KAJ2217441.1 hypothetical protein EV179_000591 [Coemansia sp. RSA 487]KAJ2572670.1 hypothetical protein IW140_000785 [Coemansia sp. RSA 1813]
MSYAEYGAQASKYMWSFFGYVHGQAFPLCASFTVQMGKQWPPFQTALDVVGPITFTYILEALFLYVSARIAIFAFKIVSSTLYRILRLILLILFIVLGLSLGLYVYFTDASNGQALTDLTKGTFWLSQASSFASMVAPMWNDELTKWKESQKNPRARKQPTFNYQAQAYM